MYVLDQNIHTPVNPSFNMSMWGLRGYTLHRHVFLMSDIALEILKFLVLKLLAKVY